jgi:hypothetical protein
MSTTDDLTKIDDCTGKEIIRERFADRRHVLEQLIELDTPLKDDAQRVLEILDETEADQS